MAHELPAFRIVAEAMPEEVLNPKDLSALGRRRQFGGQPTWEQNDETPTCAECGKPMVFVAQLDSIGFDRDNGLAAGEFIFGDVGLIYVFFCFDDGKTCSVFQCT